MKKIISILVLVSILSACNQIEPINNSSNNEIKKEDISKKWINLNEDFWINLNEEELITKRFEILSKIFKSHSDLMSSIQYEQFVDYVYDVFAKYKDLWKEESESKNNYIFNILIPKIVINNYVVPWKMTEKEAELVIQSIKRNDLNTLSDKKLITEKFKIYFEENKFNPFIKSLNTKWLTKDEKLELLFKDKDWVIYSILSNRYNWNKTWIGYKPADMEAEFMLYLNKKLEYIFWTIGVSEKEVQEYAYKKYNVDSLESLWENILNKFNILVKEYNLKWKIPLDRYYRNDERKDIFINRKTIDNYISTLSDWKSENFIKELSEIRLEMYLLSYFWRNRSDLNENQWLWSSRTRSDFIDPVFGKWVQNLFRLGRYLPWEEIKIDLNKSENNI